jgi:hypothetical protein
MEHAAQHMKIRAFVRGTFSMTLEWLSKTSMTHEFEEISLVDLAAKSLE